MNWNYISGFFDADGSISVVKNRSRNKTIQISFHNTELNILNDIQRFIFDKLNNKGFISIKPAKKPTHSDSYELKYSYKKGYEVACKLNSIHPKKKHRINVYKKIQEVTPRNGKYSDEMLEKRNNLLKEFLNH